MLAFPDWGARRPSYAVLVLPLMKCKTRSTIPDEQDVNHAGAYVKCEKPKQPKNNQNQGEQSKHVCISFFFTERDNQANACHRES